MNENKIQVFNSKEFGQLEILTIGEKPYFPATDCAKLLGYKTPQDAITRHCKGYVKHVALSNGGEQTKNFIPEGDLYRLIIRSKLPAAEQFERWVFDEILPTIRKHGGYVTDELLKRFNEKSDEAEIFFNALREERTNREVLHEYIKIIAPKAEYCDIILQCDNSIPVSVIAKDYGMTATAFNKLLHSVGIQYKIGGTWLLYQKYSGCGFTETSTYRTSTTATVHTRWTQSGRRLIYDVLKNYGVLPECERYGSGIC